MRINNNMMAMNTHRQLGAANAGGAKSMEKLSSGMRINRAGDDAAGLAISEKMRGQIRGLNQASSNSQDGISLIQTAEGALNETHAILQRMRELAVQSATDTNTETDRGEIQKEINQLTEEIDRIANTTEFNTQGLLDGSYKGTFQIGANEGQTVKLDIGKMDTVALGLTGTVSTLQGSMEDANKDNALLADGIYTVSDDKKSLLDIDGNTVAAIVDQNVINVDVAGTATKVMDVVATALLDKGAQITISGKGAKFDIKNTIDQNAIDNLPAGSYEIKGTNLLKNNVLVGEVSDDGKKITTNDGEDVTALQLGLKEDILKNGFEFTINGSDVSTRETAEASITSINKALEQVSGERSKLGAMQNRLEHTIKNLDTSAENLQASEARIRDVDMAKEMMEQTKQNILSQASTSMLANANSAPQAVLQLLG